ncbi:uncharacterized protein [Miscanthus floridulus]|uniref:uncharacterized protein n=1 Tax=Miscanthus floridulus TaxID=154761 RepID=UPI00345B1424
MCILRRYHDASTHQACAAISLHLTPCCLPPTAASASSTRRAGSKIRSGSLCSQIRDRHSSCPMMESSVLRSIISSPAQLKRTKLFGATIFLGRSSLPSVRSASREDTAKEGQSPPNRREVITGNVNVHPDALPASAIRTSPSPPRPAAASSPSPSHPRRARPCRRLLAISPRARTRVRFPSPSTRSAGQPTTPAKLVTRPVLAPPPGCQGAGHQGAREGERDVRKPWSPDPPRWAASAAMRSHRARGGSHGSCALTPTTAAAPPSCSGADQIRRRHLSILTGGGTLLRAPAAALYSTSVTATASSPRPPPCCLRPPLGRLPLPLPGQRRFLSLGASARGCGASPRHRRCRCPGSVHPCRQAGE